MDSLQDIISVIIWIIMVAASRAAAGMGYIGYPAQIFYEKINFNRGPQMHVERLFILLKWYSNLRAYLPIVYEKNSEEYFKEILPRLDAVNERLWDTWKCYKSTFETPSYDPDEHDFVVQVAMILIELDEITAISKVIDKQGFSDEVVSFVGGI